MSARRLLSSHRVGGKHAESTNRTAQESLAIDPNDEVAWFGLGKAYMEDGNFEEAAKALQQCITVKPTYSAAYYAWLNHCTSWDRIDECRTVCATGIEVSTKNGDAMVTKNLEALKNFHCHNS